MHALDTVDSDVVAGLPRRAVETQRGLPYGSVMATAGASALAGPCGLESLVVPLLLLAVALALWVPAAGAWRWRGRPAAEWRARWAIGPAHRHAGIHTVPLGLAVITGGLVALVAHAASPRLLAAAIACLGLTWALTLASVGRFAWSLLTRPITLQALDGAWFLAPAALLGAGIASADVASLADGSATRGLAVLALVAAVTGWLGYWALAIAAAVRVRRYGLGGVPQAPWWIAMGCAGLACAALGRVPVFTAVNSPLHQALVVALAGTAVFALVLCVPVLVASVQFLLRRCRFQDAAKWPPTFSTAVLALGCLAAGEVLGAGAFRSVGLGAGYATLLLWAATAGWNGVRLGRGLWQRLRGVGVRGMDQ